MDKEISKGVEKLSLSFYAKVMDREVYFTPNIISDLSMALINLSQKHSLERSLLLLDTVVSVASITGFPIELQVESAASINFNLLRNKNTKLTDIDLSMKSNCGIKLTGKLFLNAQFTRIGVQSKATMSNDLEFGGKLKLDNVENFKEINYQFDLTKISDNSKLFSISNELSLIHTLEKVASIEKYDIKLEKCTGEGLMKIMGVKICASYKEAPKFSSILLNIKADVTIESFRGIKAVLKTKSYMKPIRKLQSLLFSLSFPNANEDTFRFKIERDKKSKYSMYELLLWQKKTYLKLEIKDKAISGEIKSGETEGILSGSFGSKGIFVLEMKVDIKSDKNSGKFYFQQRFTKNGPEITVKLSKSGINGFNILSKTSVRLTEHKLFNYFQRFRHSTNIKYSGENEMSFMVETSEANKPLIEYISKLEIFWKIKAIKKFYVNQAYIWKKIPDSDNSDMFGKISGHSYFINLDHDIEVKGKKFNITNNFAFFLSNNFLSIRQKPSIFMIKLKREDLIKKENIFESYCRFGIDISNFEDVKIVSENLIKYDKLKFKRIMNSKMTWKLNQLRMYDIDAELKGISSELLFKHKFSSTQNGITTVKMRMGNDNYEISSELNLPRSHILIITWPNNNVLIDSKVNVSDLMPFHLIASHELKVNNKLLTTIINSAKYNKEQQGLSLRSRGMSNENKEIYSFSFDRKLNYKISKKQIFYDYFTSMGLKISENNFDKRLSIEQYFDSENNIKKSIFNSKVILENVSKDKKQLKYGYEISVKNQKDSISYKVISLNSFRRDSNDQVILKWGREKYNITVGASVNIKDILISELNYKMIVTNKIAKTLLLLKLNSKNEPEYNFYFKKNIVANWANKNSFSLKWNGEFGKENIKEKLGSFNGLLNFNQDGYRKIDISLSMNNPVRYTSFANVNYILSYEFNDKEKDNYKIIFNTASKWQKVGIRTANYYDLQINGNFDKLYKKTEFDLILTKDSTLNKILLIKARESTDLNFELSLNIGKTNTTLAINSKTNDGNNKILGLELRTSSGLLKELVLGIEYKFKDNKTLMLCNMKLNSNKDSYNITLNRIQEKNFNSKIYLVEKVNWDSNIPYIKSGSTNLNIFSQINVLKCDFFLEHEQKSLIVFKVETSDISRNLNFEMKSTIQKTLKIQSKYLINDNKISYELDTFYDNTYVKIPTMEIINRRTVNDVLFSINVAVKTSIKDIEEIFFITNTNYELTNIFKSYKHKTMLKANGKSLESYIIDFEKREIQIESVIGQYIKISEFQTFQLDLKYQLESINDIMIEYKSITNKNQVTELKIVYFRMTDKNKPKTINFLGEAMYFLALEYKKKVCNGKFILFIEKEIKKASITMNADFPLIEMKVKEVAFKFENINKDGNMFSGIVTYKDATYQYAYEKSNEYKQMFEMKATDITSVPQKVIFFFDLRKDYIFKLLFDEYFDFDIKLNSLSQNLNAGQIRFIYKNNEIINLKTSVKIVIPKDSKMVIDFLKALLGITSGIDLSLEIDGKIIKNVVKTNFEISHLESHLFPGGTKTNVYFDLEMKNENVEKYFIKGIFDRKYPMFNYKDEILIKKNEIIHFEQTSIIKYISIKNISVEGIINYTKVSFKTILLNNPETIKGSLYNKRKENENSFGFEVVKPTFDITIYNAVGLKNASLKTNFGYIIKKVYPIGKIYYFSMKNEFESYNIQIKRNKERSIELKFDFKNKENEIVCTVNAFNEWKTKNNLGIEIKGETSYNSIKSFLFKSDVKFAKKFYTMNFTSNLNVNKKSIMDLIIQYRTNKRYSPYELEIKFKGKNIILSSALIDLKKLKFSHLIEVKEKKYKSLLWSSASRCTVSSEFDCYLNHTNKARDMAIGVTWIKNLKNFELNWNKKEGHGLLFRNEKNSKSVIITLSTPLRTLKITKIKKFKKDNTRNQLFMEIFKKTTSNQPITFSLDYLIVGSLNTDYNLDLLINSNLMQKIFLINIKRDLRMTVSEIYTLKVNALVEGEEKSLFGFEGNLRQLSSANYEIKMNATNKDNFLGIILKTSVNSEELSLEYKIYQSDKKPKEFIFQCVPFKKILITNKDDIKILISRTDYDYGHRRDLILNLGKKGPNIESYTKFIKSPLKYYAEISSNGSRVVVNFRPVDNTFIGEVYRNVKGYKMSDLSLKLGIDTNNILFSNIYWNTKSLEIFKAWLKTIFKPNNFKVLLNTVYEGFENQFSTFSSKIKLDLVKKINIQLALDFLKDLVNDIEQIPKVLTQVYSDDTLFMKSLMKNVENGFKKMKIGEIFSQSKNNMSNIFLSFSDQLYEWFINGKLYSFIYKVINNKIEIITYSDIKVFIEKIVKITKVIGKNLNSHIKSICNILDSLSEKVKVASDLVADLNKNIISIYNGSTFNQLIILINDFKDELLNGVTEIVEAQFIQERIKYYKESIENIKEFINIMKEMKNQIMKYIKSSNLVGHIIETLELIKSIKFKEAFLNLIKPKEAKLDMDLDKATMDIRLYISPMFGYTAKVWKTALDWFPFELISRIQGSGFGGKLLSLFYKYEYLIFNFGSKGSLRTLIPPFEKIAWILEENSILTFDGSSFRIGSGKCSYLLARDTKFGSFSLVMNVLSNVKSFDLFYIKKITLLSSGIIKVNGKVINTLPQILTSKSKTIEIYRNYDIIQIKTSEGLNIEYFIHLNYLKVTLGGYWHGSVKGLLGSNDFESINDLATPSGTITYDIGILTKSWSMDTCKSETKTGLHSIKVNNKQLQRCVTQFKVDSLSYLQRCFSLVNPETYFELCRSSLQYKEMNNKEFKKFLCELTRNYVIRCQSQGMMIRLEKSCITCGSKKLFEISSLLNLKKHLKFSYIFIVEQSKYIVPYKDLFDNLVKIMGLQKNNIYSLISFNGRSIFKSAHFKSLNNEFTTDNEGFKTLFSDVLSTSQISGHSLSNYSTEHAQAIYNAIKMPSKPGYIERIVFVSSTACGKNKKYGFSFLAELLNKYGISLTYITTQPLTSKTLKLESVGIGNNNVHYFENDILKKKLLRKDVQLLKDECSNLARLNDGFIWSLNHINSKMRLRRVTDALHNELIKVKPNPKQKCFCRIGNYEDGVVECEVEGLL